MFKIIEGYYENGKLWGKKHYYETEQTYRTYLKYHKNFHKNYGREDSGVEGYKMVNNKWKLIDKCPPWINVYCE